MAGDPNILKIPEGFEFKGNEQIEYNELLSLPRRELEQIFEREKKEAYKKINGLINAIDAANKKHPKFTKLKSLKEVWDFIQPPIPANRDQNAIRGNLAIIIQFVFRRFLTFIPDFPIIDNATQSYFGIYGSGWRSIITNQGLDAANIANKEKVFEGIGLILPANRIGEERANRRRRSPLVATKPSQGIMPTRRKIIFAHPKTTMNKIRAAVTKRRHTRPTAPPLTPTPTPSPPAPFPQSPFVSQESLPTPPPAEQRKTWANIARTQPPRPPIVPQPVKASLSPPSPVPFPLSPLEVEPETPCPPGEQLFSDNFLGSFCCDPNDVWSVKWGDRFYTICGVLNEDEMPEIVAESASTEGSSGSTELSEFSFESPSPQETQPLNPNACQVLFDKINKLRLSIEKNQQYLTRAKTQKNRRERKKQTHRYSTILKKAKKELNKKLRKFTRSCIPRIETPTSNTQNTGSTNSSSSNRPSRRRTRGPDFASLSRAQQLSILILSYLAAVDAPKMTAGPASRFINFDTMSSSLVPVGSVRNLTVVDRQLGTYGTGFPWRPAPPVVNMGSQLVAVGPVINPNIIDGQVGFYGTNYPREWEPPSPPKEPNLKGALLTNQGSFSYKTLKFGKDKYDLTEPVVIEPGMKVKDVQDRIYEKAPPAAKRRLATIWSGFQISNGREKIKLEKTNGSFYDRKNTIVEK